VTSPEEGRIDLCDSAVVTSSSVDNFSEVNKPCMDNKSEKSKSIPLSTIVGGKEERNGGAPQAENFLGGVVLHKDVEVSQQTPSDKSDQLYPPDKSTASNIVYDKFVASKSSDATSPDNSTTRWPRKVELIPRPVRDRQRPAKYDDFETKFVRMIRRPRDQGDKPTSPPDSRKRRVSFEPNRIEIEPEMTELEAENLTPAKRIVRQKKIETDQSESEKSDQSEGENYALFNAAINADNDANKTRARTQNLASEFPPTDEDNLAVTQKCRPLNWSRDAPLRRSSTESVRRMQEKYKRQSFPQLTICDRAGRTAMSYTVS